jgi:hypothetical protein
VSAGFSARFPGACPECAEWFTVGTTVFYNTHGELIHERCPDSLAEPTPTEPLCPRCFCYHAGECL